MCIPLMFDVPAVQPVTNEPKIVVLFIAQQLNNGSCLLTSFELSKLLGTGFSLF